jgi:hypothetical protein
MEPTIPFIGFSIGILVGLSGMGGGALMTPLLILVVGVRPVIAIGTDLAYAALTKGFGAWQHYRQGKVDTKIAFPMMSSSIPASLLGVYLIHILKSVYQIDVDALVKSALGLVLILVALILFSLPLFFQQRDTTQIIHLRGPKVIKSIILGAIVGFLVGFTSIGSGTLIFAGLAFCSALPLKRIVSTDIFHGSFLTAAAALAHWWTANIDFGILFPLLIGSIPGVLIGSRLSGSLPNWILRPILASMLLIAGIKLM